MWMIYIEVELYQRIDGRDGRLNMGNRGVTADRREWRPKPFVPHMNWDTDKKMMMSLYTA